MTDKEIHQWCDKISSKFFHSTFTQVLFCLSPASFDEVFKKYKEFMRGHIEDYVRQICFEAVKDDEKNKKTSTK